MSEGAPARAAAARVLADVLRDGRSLRNALAPALPQLAEARDRALVEALVFAALRGRVRYEALLQRLLERPLPRKLSEVQALLLVGLAQLDALGITPYAAISASAEAARTLGHPRHVGLVNAVLRRFQRERDALLASIQAEPSLAHGHPAWLAAAVRAAYPDAADSVMRANLAEAPLWLRVNPLRTTREDYLRRLADDGIEAEAPDWLPQAVCLPQRVAPTRLPGWAEGWVSVQDGSAQAAVEALDARPGQCVLDACAAPGGKTAHLQERARGTLDLWAVERDPARAERLVETLARLGLSARIEIADAADPGWSDGQRFDRILLDAPCSATGIVRRQPDILVHRRAQDLPPLLGEQARLLDALWPMLRPGGRLVYATCSVLPDENARQIDAFLARHPDAHALPAPLPLGRPSGAGFQRLPGEDGMDGFFVALLGRSA